MIVKIDDYNALKLALRRMGAEFFADDDPDGAIFDSKLVASELVTNALRYGGGSARLLVERTGGDLHISVRGEKDFRPPKESACSDPTAERGRGLYLVDALCISRDYSEENGVHVVIRLRP